MPAADERAAGIGVVDDDDPTGAARAGADEPESDVVGIEGTPGTTAAGPTTTEFDAALASLRSPDGPIVSSRVGVAGSVDATCLSCGAAGV
jgi:hypothetical protein